MRLESLDIDHPQGAHDELDGLADELRRRGFTVQVAEIGAPHWSRMHESAEHALVDVLNVVLEESERHMIDAVIDVLVAWAATRCFFRGRAGAKPHVVVWFDAEIVRTVPLPEKRFDVLLQVEVANLAAAKELEHAINEALPDGDGLKLTAAGDVAGVHYQAGIAEVRAEVEQQAAATLQEAFGAQGLRLVRHDRWPGDDVPLLIFAPPTDGQLD